MNPECLNPDQIQRLLKGHISGSEQSSVERHLETCADCRQRLETAGGDGIELDPRDLAALETASNWLQSAIERLKSRTLSTYSGLVQDRDEQIDLNGILEPSVHPGDLGMLGHYRILGVIGSGGMGIVLRGHDLHLDRSVAIKVMRPEIAAHPDARERFTQEARAAAAVQHDNLVTIHAVNASSSVPWIVMELVEGTSLQKWIEAGRIDRQKIIEVARDVAAGLAAAHAKGLIHRDIKPANILIQESNGRARITDFGLARAGAEPRSDNAGVIAGTPEYMSPEQTRGASVDARSDLFSLGLVLTAMTIGHSPLHGSTVIETMRRICQERLPPLAEESSELPAWFCELVDQLLEKDPEQRIQTAQEVAARLQKHTAGQLKEIRSRPVLMAALAMSLVVSSVLCYGIFDGWFNAADVPADGSSLGRVEPITIRGRIGSWDSLSQAIAAASSGDTIEIAVNGSVIGEPIQVNNKTLTIGAAKGYLPVIVAAAGNQSPLLTTNSDLVLEDIEIRWLIAEPSTDYSRTAMQSHCAILVENGQTTLRRCRVACQEKCAGVTVANGQLKLESSFLVMPDSPGVFWISRNESEIQVSNCVFDCRYAVVADHDPAASGSWKQMIKFESSSILSDELLLCIVHGLAAAPRTVQISNCLLDVNTICHISTARQTPRTVFLPSESQVTRMLTGTIDWQESVNVYDLPVDFVVCSILARQRTATVVGPRTLADWNRLWKRAETGSAELELELQVRAKAGEIPRWQPAPGKVWPNNSSSFGANTESVGPASQIDRSK